MLEPRFRAVKDDCDRLLNLNQEAMRGIGGLVAPFPCIWAIDRMLGLLHLA